MWRRTAVWLGPIWLGLLAAAALGGCAASAPPTLPGSAAGIETSALAAPAPVSAPEVTIIAQGSTTAAYTQVAHGALRCWLGADGPLKATHVFNAEAASPAQGGAAEIVLHERDPAQRDQRGNRAFRISFTAEVTGVRLGITNIKMADAAAQLLVRDVETWVKGGEGCQARALSPPKAEPPPAPAPPAAKRQKRV